jgi:hypothetical protein
MKRIVKTSLVALCLALVAGGCGDRAVDAVSAINLETGEIKSYPSADKVPAGWASCSDADCSDFPAVPCQNLGDNVCEKNPNCRLVEDWCSGGINCTTPAGEGGGDTGTNSDGDTATPCDETVAPPPKCEFKCLAKTPLLCDELTEASDCKGRPDCEWGPGVCPAIACGPEGDCPPCLETCQPKQAAPCENLGQNACEESSECSWIIAPCLACDPSSTDGCECPSFCQPQTEPSCPALPTPVTCPPNSESVPVYDEYGCITDYTCQNLCPSMPMPMCEEGTELVTFYDDAGCVMYECKATTTTCGELFEEYKKTVVEAKSCMGVLTYAAQCDTAMPSQLACGCDTFVNNSNGAAVAKLKALKTAWDATTCAQQINCITLPCIAPKSASCNAPEGGTGTCQDVQP